MIKKRLKLVLNLLLISSAIEASDSDLGDNCIPKKLYRHNLSRTVTAISRTGQTEQILLPECKTTAYLCNDQHMASLMRACCYQNQLAYVPYGNSTGFCY